MIGVARSDPFGWTGQALGEIRRSTPERDVQAVADLVQEQDACRVVVGLPRSLNGSLGPQADKVLAFVDSLRAALDRPVVLWDERFTTASAQRMLIAADVRRRDRRRVVDRVAAALILQSYLDARESGGVEHRTGRNEPREPRPGPLPGPETADGADCVCRVR